MLYNEIPHPSQVKFGASNPKTNPTDPKHQTLENARQFTKDFVSEVRGQHLLKQAASEVTKAKRTLRSTLGDFEYGLWIPGIITGCLSSIGLLIGYGDKLDPPSSQPPQTTLNAPNQPEVNHDSEKAAKFGLLALFGIPVLLLVFLKQYDECWQYPLAEVKKAKAWAKEQKNQLIFYKLPEKPEDHLLQENLEKQMTEEAQAFAGNLAKFYNEEPLARPWFHQAFGPEKKDLPDGETIRDLFLYYAYQKQASERRLGKLPTLSRLALVKDAYTLMKSSRELGELFQFVEPSKRSAYGERFVKEFLGKSAVGQTQINHIATLCNRENDLDQHLISLNRLILSLGISNHYPQETREELHALRKKLQAQKTSYKALGPKALEPQGSAPTPQPGNAASHHPVPAYLAGLAHKQLPLSALPQESAYTVLESRFEALIDQSARTLATRLQETSNRSSDDSSGAASTLNDLFGASSNLPDGEMIKSFFLHQSATAIENIPGYSAKGKLNRILWLQHTYSTLKSVEDLGGLIEMILHAAEISSNPPLQSLLSKATQLSEAEVNEWAKDFIQSFRDMEKKDATLTEKRSELVQYGLSPRTRQEYLNLKQWMLQLEAEKTKLAEGLSQSSPTLKTTTELLSERNEAIHRQTDGFLSSILENEFDLKVHSLTQLDALSITAPQSIQSVS